MDAFASSQPENPYTAVSGGGTLGHLELSAERKERSRS